MKHHEIVIKVVIAIASARSPSISLKMGKKKILSLCKATLYTIVFVYVSIDLSPLNSPILGTFKEFSFLVPPELGARGD